MTDWVSLSQWWRHEVGSDPAYEADVAPLIAELIRADIGERILDVGCGDGRLMGWLASTGSVTCGVDLSEDLLTSARAFGPVVRAELPMLTWCRDGVFDAAFVSLVLEHLDDETSLFTELGRVVRKGGRLAMVLNHPIFTAPESAPIQEDDEVLWRPGRYFGRGYSDEKAGDDTIRFHHRTIAELLTAAAAGGWDLERMVELGVTEAQIARHPALEQQRHIPRLMGVAWVRRHLS